MYPLYLYNMEKLIKKILREGPICGDKTGDACGNCGDGYVWTDSYVTNSCICNHSGGAVCHDTGSGMYGNNGDIITLDDLYTPDGLKNKGKGDKAIDSLRHVKLESKSKKTTNMKRNITKTDLKRIVGRVLSEHPLPPPNHLHTHSSCQACDCFFDMTWSQGHQYGGYVEMEGCMQPAGGKLTLYVNNVMQYSSTSLVGTNGTNITWGNAQTAIIRVKAVMECYGSHPSCSAENVEKTICVRKSDGQKVPCRKTIPKGELMKHDDAKTLGVNLSDNDVELESPYDAEDIRESRLNFIIKKTLRETVKQLNEAPNCYYRRRNYANSGYTCVARKCGFTGSNKAFYPGEFSSMDDCNSMTVTPGSPGGFDNFMDMDNNFEAKRKPSIDKMSFNSRKFR